MPQICSTHAQHVFRSTHASLVMPAEVHLAAAVQLLD